MTFDDIKTAKGGDLQVNTHPPNLKGKNKSGSMNVPFCPKQWKEEEGTGDKAETTQHLRQKIKSKTVGVSGQGYAPTMVKTPYSPRSVDILGNQHS